MKLLAVVFKPEEAAGLAAFASAMALPFDLLCLGGTPDDGFGAGEVLEATGDSLPPADSLGKDLARLSSGYSHLAAISSMRSKDVLPRVAALLGGAMVTDVVAVESPCRFRRLVAAGSLCATIEADASPIVMTVRPAGFPPAAKKGFAEPRIVTLLTNSRTRVISSTVEKGTRPDLTLAGVVVTGGRPLQDSANFERLIGGLADALDGATGATRAAVDAGVAPNEMQIGQTGKIVAPDLYIAAGVSGSTQHIAGIKDAKLIVAINNDPAAPIFEIADVGWVADLFIAIPELIAALEHEKSATSADGGRP